MLGADLHQITSNHMNFFEFKRILDLLSHSKILARPQVLSAYLFGSSSHNEMPSSYGVCLYHCALEIANVGINSSFLKQSLACLVFFIKNLPESEALIRHVPLICVVLANG